MKYFNVKRTVKIGSKVYKPCVCYPCPDSLLFTVRSLSEQGIAELHEREVFFQSGKMLDPEELAARVREKKAAERAQRRKARDEQLAKQAADVEGQ